MINKLGQFNWMQQSAIPISGKQSGGVENKNPFSQDNGNKNGGDLMSRLSALDNLELRPKTDSKLDFYA